MVDKKYYADVSISTIIVFLAWISCYTTGNYELEHGGYVGMSGYGELTFFASGDCLEGLRTIMQVMHIDWFIFDECDLRDLDLSERNLNGAHFIRVEARGAFFIKSQLQDADFSDADLRNTYFVEADLRNANFGGADLRGAIFTRADLRGARFHDCFTDEHTTWQDAKFDDDKREISPERITDGIKKIDLMDVYLFEEEEA